MNAQANTVEELVASGLISAELGVVLSNSDDEGDMLGAIIASATASTARANAAARKTNVPLVYAENGTLYRVFPDGTREFVRALPPSSKPLSHYIILK